MSETPRVCMEIVSVEEAKRFIIDCATAAGIPKENADVLAKSLVEADSRGHYSHGMNRLEKYIASIKSNQLNANASPTIEKETPVTAVVDGHNGLGAVIGHFCMQLCIKKAKEMGIAMVVTHSSNHYGISGLYSLMAIKEGLIGMTFTNTSPLVVPTRAKDPALGTNPLALGAPAANNDYFLLDIATSAVALGKIELAKRKGQKIPEGWALNKDGQVETDPEIAYEAGRLLPLGGTEQHSGYKGFGLGILVEVLSGLLSGSNSGPDVPVWGRSTKTMNIGHGFIAIDPKVFVPGFEDRLFKLMQSIRSMPPADPSRPIMISGDFEKYQTKKIKENGGLCYSKGQLDAFKKMAEDLNVPAMKTVCHKV